MEEKRDPALEAAIRKAEEAKKAADAAKAQKEAENPFYVAPNQDSEIKNVIGIVSGKGGVGKSTVTAALAVALKRKGYKVGILDADITGPSIPKMFGVKQIGGIVGEQMLPAQSASGIQIMSVNLLMEEEEAPVIWRGPAIAGIVKQFWSDVIWGELDYLLVDMPPGTGDVPLTVFQSLPVTGILLVTSPQSLVEMVVKKAYNMAEQMNIPVLGVIENFSYVVCPDCGKKIYVFGENTLKGWSEKSGVKVVERLPMDSAVAELADEGRMEALDPGYLYEAADTITELTQK
ncbi:MAG: Mrp/NBP35 family ATP-binding protein [Lachnospiraceae bacterium]|nr:Mrp/NBP35 family ATP-binding protein [Lachnospiraceae bacterium]